MFISKLIMLLIAFALVLSLIHDIFNDLSLPLHIIWHMKDLL